MPTSVPTSSKSIFFLSSTATPLLTCTHTYKFSIVSENLFNYLAVMGSSFLIGYWVGMGRSLGYTRSGSTSLPSSDEDENGFHSETEGMTAKAGPMEECKLVLVVRTDLGMTKGKIAAQCGHATLACYKALRKANPTLLRQWEYTGQAKIALKLEPTEGNSEEDEMLLLKARAHSLGLCARDIQDAGRTQIAAGSRTVLGIGPGPVGLIDQVTRHLKLL
ncbi:hypothetical protein CROQUDRAFT_37414 [Cronartium quercuum f. sp. fusiforme G11]|uniref:peptidyl-tRNA hydrolase n=1 Tax=Cronartium quercuum f. sp. fusiforme G11 TaxID=708437 RepID=A0A9P6TFS3_9BASI|nr:hypothetical protein CROQUDRAFT_37414 [Cronartium quercuum f. sp. fusiforme G11]